MNKIIYLTPLMFALAACASITNDTTQNIGLDTEPTGASRTLSSDDAKPDEVSIK